MRHVILLAAAVLFLAVMLLFLPAPPIEAQSRGAARPAPRTSDGKPDFTGVYQGGSSKRGDWDFQVPSDQPGVPTVATQTAATSQSRRDPIPFQPWAREKAQEFVNMRSINDPTSRCLPGPSPRANSVALFPIQFVQTPKQIVVLYEYFNVFRVIPLDQKSHPDDLEPSFLGHSIGRWEGNTLVVDIVGFNDKGWVLSGGIFHSDALHITERYTRVDYDTINYEATIEDKKVFTQPFKTSTTMMLREGQRLREYICPENNEDVLRLEKLLDNPELFRRNPAAPKPQ
jgi:hypothetical protein